MYPTYIFRWAPLKFISFWHFCLWIRYITTVRVINVWYFQTTLYQTYSNLFEGRGTFQAHWQETLLKKLHSLKMQSLTAFLKNDLRSSSKSCSLISSSTTKMPWISLLLRMLRDLQNDDEQIRGKGDLPALRLSSFNIKRCGRKDIV